MCAYSWSYRLDNSLQREDPQTRWELGGRAGDTWFRLLNLVLVAACRRCFPQKAQQGGGKGK